MRGTLAGTRMESKLAAAHAATADPGRAEEPMRANLLIGVALHAAARVARGLTPTVLEAEHLTILRRIAESESHVTALGEWFDQARADREELPLVPEVILSMATSSGYTWEDLKRDTPAMIQAQAAKPNVVLMDREAYAVGAVFDSEDFVEAMAGPAFGANVFVRPFGDPDSSPAPAGAGVEGRAAELEPFRARIEAVSFDVIKAVGDQGGGRDEIYWVSAPTTDQEPGGIWHSEEFGKVKTGDKRNFGSNNVVAEGEMVHRLVFGVQCWEADQASSAWYDALHNQLAAFRDGVFADRGFMVGSSMPGMDLIGWMVEINNLGVFLMEHLRNGDDMSSSRAFVLDRYDLSLIKEHGGAAWNFNGDGHHVLRVKYTGDPIPFPAGTLEYRVQTGNRWGEPIPLPWRSITAPALCSHKGLLYAVYARPDRALMWTCLKNRVWSRPEQINDATTVVAAALSEISGLYSDLHCLYATPDGTIHRTQFDGTSWSPGISTGGSTARGLGLASLDGRLVGATVGLDDTVFWSVGPDFVWRRENLGWTLKNPVALANDHRGSLWRMACGQDHRIYTAGIQAPLASWSSDPATFPTITQADVTHTPALVAASNTMYAYMRGSDERLWESKYPPMGGWSQPVVVGGEPGTTLYDEPAAAFHIQGTYVMYRR